LGGKLAERTQSGEVGILVHDVPLRQLFLTFFKISCIAWGGGAGTIFTMVQELTRRGWITREQFALDFGLSRIVPGINLLAVAVMLGYRLNGPLGSIVSCIGFTMPASIITLVLTVGFAEVTSTAIGGAAIKGAVAVTAALTFALAYQTAVEIIPWKERRQATLMIAYAFGSFLLVSAFHVSVAVVIVLGGVLGVLFFKPDTLD
jgi:chromate transporter